MSLLLLLRPRIEAPQIPIQPVAVKVTGAGGFVTDPGWINIFAVQRQRQTFSNLSDDVITPPRVPAWVKIKPVKAVAEGGRVKISSQAWRKSRRITIHRFEGLLEDESLAITFLLEE